MSLEHYQQLKVWQKAKDLAVLCYQITQTFPKTEVYGIISQIRRASVSIASNIAEGQGRNHTLEFIQSLGIAKGSLYELETQLLISQEVGFLSDHDATALLSACSEIGKMLSGLKKALQDKMP